MNIFSVKTKRLGSVGVDLLCGLNPARPHDVLPGEGEIDIVDAEIGEEFRIRVVLMAVPRAMPEDTYLRKPLAAHDEIALISVARHGEGEFVMKGDVKTHRAAWRERFWKRHF